MILNVDRQRGLLKYFILRFKIKIFLRKILIYAHIILILRLILKFSEKI